MTRGISSKDEESMNAGKITIHMKLEMCLPRIGGWEIGGGGYGGRKNTNGLTWLVLEVRMCQGYPSSSGSYGLYDT